MVVPIVSVVGVSVVTVVPVGVVVPIVSVVGVSVVTVVAGGVVVPIVPVVGVSVVTVVATVSGGVVVSGSLTCICHPRNW